MGQQRRVVEEKVNDILAEVRNYHGRSSDIHGFPYHLTKPEGPHQKAHFIGQKDGRDIFFVSNNKMGVCSLPPVVIRNLTVIGAVTGEKRRTFSEYLRKLGDSFSFLVESYNKPAMDILADVDLRTTHYCQQKMICQVDDLNLREEGLPDGVRIRNFEPDRDSEKYVEFYNKTLGFLGIRVGSDFIDSVISRASFDPAGYFIAECGNEIEGFLAIEKNPWGDPSDTFGYIYQIGVNDRLRGTGLAGALLTKGKVFAQEIGIERIGVGTRRSNMAAVRFFEKRGFRVAYKVIGYIVDFGKGR